MISAMTDQLPKRWVRRVARRHSVCCLFLLYCSLLLQPVWGLSLLSPLCHESLLLRFFLTFAFSTSIALGLCFAA